MSFIKQWIIDQERKIDEDLMFCDADRQYHLEQAMREEYEAGEPLQHHFIFSKKGAIKRCIKLAQEYDVANQEAIDDSRGLSAYDIKFRNGYGQSYPAERPHYC